MINLQTILSSFDDKETLLKWLKKVEKALAESVLESVEVTQVDATHIKLKFNFEDETSLESESLTLPRGEAGQDGEDGQDGQDGEDGKDYLLYTEIVESEHLSQVFNLDPSKFNRTPVVNEKFIVLYTYAGNTYIALYKIINLSASSANCGPATASSYTSIQGAKGDKGDKGDPTDAEGLLDLIEGSETIVVDLAEDGEHVEVHLDADIVNKIDNSLQLPQQAPATEKLVAIGTNGAQKLVDASSGGTQFYKHVLSLSGLSGADFSSITLYSTSNVEITALTGIIAVDTNIIKIYIDNSMKSQLFIASNNSLPTAYIITSEGIQEKFAIVGPNAPTVTRDIVTII